jgi:hypothetical protein
MTSTPGFFVFDRHVHNHYHYHAPSQPRQLRGRIRRALMTGAAVATIVTSMGLSPASTASSSEEATNTIVIILTVPSAQSPPSDRHAKPANHRPLRRSLPDRMLCTRHEDHWDRLACRSGWWSLIPKTGSEPRGSARGRVVRLQFSCPEWLLGSYSNPEIQGRLRQLSEKLERLEASDAAPCPSGRQDRRLRGGLVPGAIEAS